jgi:predicted phage terminase large subunit-like protein
MANDPAKGVTNKNDTKAWVILGLTADEKHIDVIHAWIRRATIDKMVREGFSLYDRFYPHKSVIEANGFQSLLKTVIEQLAVIEKKGIAFKSSIKLLQNNSNKNVRIMRLQNGIEHGFFRFVRGSDMQRLVNQFLDFDSGKSNNEDDGPDAMEMANRMLQRLNGQSGDVEVEIIG